MGLADRPQAGQVSEMWSSVSPNAGFRLPPIDGAHVWRVALDQPTDVVAQLAACLSPAERDRAGRFRGAILTRRYEAAHGALRRILGAYLDRAPETVSFVTNPHGKPDLDIDGRLTFNLSHSGPQALIAVARGRSVGVDLEVVRDLPEAADFARRNFAAEEWQAWSATAAARQMDAFFAYWTAKEAYLKALGLGLARPLDSFAVAVDSVGSVRLLRDALDPDAPNRWCLARLQPGQDTSAAIAVDGPLNALEAFAYSPW